MNLVLFFPLLKSKPWLLYVMASELRIQLIPPQHGVHFESSLQSSEMSSESWSSEGEGLTISHFFFSLFSSQNE